MGFLLGSGQDPAGPRQWLQEPQQPHRCGGGNSTPWRSAWEICTGKGVLVRRESAAICVRKLSGRCSPLPIWRPHWGWGADARLQEPVPEAAPQGLRQPLHAALQAPSGPRCCPLGAKAAPSEQTAVADTCNTTDDRHCALTVPVSWAPRALYFIHLGGPSLEPCEWVSLCQFKVGKIESQRGCPSAEVTQEDAEAERVSRSAWESGWGLRSSRGSHCKCGAEGKWGPQNQ